MVLHFIPFVFFHKGAFLYQEAVRFHRKIDTKFSLPQFSIYHLKTNSQPLDLVIFTSFPKYNSGSAKLPTYKRGLKTNICMPKGETRHVFAFTTKVLTNSQPHRREVKTKALLCLLKWQQIEFPCGLT